MRTIPALIAVLATSALSEAAAPRSGLAVGESPAPFEVLDAAGASAGQSVCYRCKYGDEPVIAVFIRDLPEINVQLIQTLEEKLKEDKRLHAFVVLLSDDAPKGAAELRKAGKEAGVQRVALTVYPNLQGPKEYKLAENVKTTVLMWSHSKVRANVSFKNGLHCEACIGSVVAELPKLAP